MRFLVACALATVCASGNWAISAEIVLTGPVGTSQTLNGAIFSVYGGAPAGTGTINPFLRLHDTGNGDGIQSGYNSGSPPDFPAGFPDQDQMTGNFTRNLTLGEVGVMDIGGSLYRTFLLDLNEPNGQGQSEIALTQLQIYVDSQANLVGLGNLGQPIFDLDSDEDNTAVLYDQFAGSGQFDVMIGIPDALFNGFDLGSYLYLFAQFQQITIGNITYSGPEGGFEEFAALRVNGLPGPALGPTMPEPASLVIWSVLLGGAAASRVYRARSKKTAAL